MAAPLAAIAGNNFIIIEFVSPYFKRPSTNSYVETYQAFRINTFFNPPDLPLYCPAIAPDPIPLQIEPGMGQGATTGHHLTPSLLGTYLFFGDDDRKSHTDVRASQRKNALPAEWKHPHSHPTHLRDA